MYQSQVRYSYDELALVELDIGGEEDSELDETIHNLLINYFAYSLCILLIFRHLKF